VVTDDHSSDATAQEVRSIADPRVSFAELDRNSGVCAAVNASIERSSGQYVAMLSSDDLFLPAKLAKEARFLDEHDDVGAVFGYPTFIDEAGAPLADDETFYGGVFRVRNRSRDQWLRHLFLHGNMLCSSTALVRRRCYDEVGPFDPALAQVPDLEMWVRLLKRHQIHVIEEPLAAFRIIDDQKNASAPRPEGVVRLHWELRKVLEHYLDLNRAEFAKVFPEFAALMLKMKNTEQFKRAVDALVRFRETLPSSQKEELSKLINNNFMRPIGDRKKSAGFKDQSDYIYSMIQ